MKIPKYFLEWFRSYGLLDDGWTDMGLGVQNRIKRIAWRAYRRGILDTKINSDLLGGFMIHTNTIKIDTSLKNDLESIKKNILRRG